MSEGNEVHVGHDEPADPTIIGNELPRLRAMAELSDFKVHEDDPDIRGWVIRDVSGATIGKVHDLIVEMDNRTVRYLCVALSARDTDSERHVLVPIGLARLNDDSNIVTLAAISREDLEKLPPYDHKTLSRDRECELVGQLQGLAEPAADTPRFYEHAVFGTQGFWGARRAPEALMTYQLIAIAEAADED